MAGDDGDGQPRSGRRRGARRALPRSALGLSLVLLLMAVASAFTGAVLYAFYEYRLGQTEDRVEEFRSSFTDRIEDAVERIEAERDTAVAEVQAQLDELERFAASGETLAGLLEGAEASVWFVETLDEAGGPSVGSAFVAFADADQSFLVTSFEAVRAATQDPAPGITLRKGDDSVPATLSRWDPPNDLALLVVDRGGLPALEWAPTDPPARVGDRLFSLSGLGGSGGAITQGFVAGVSAEGVQHDAPVGAAFRGGPLVSSQGQVVAVASGAYAPLGFDPGAVSFGVPIRRTCGELISCPDDGPPG